MASGSDGEGDAGAGVVGASTPEEALRRARLLILGLLVPVLAAACSDNGTGPDDAGGPRTGFERRDGVEFTTHGEEVAFLAEVDARSARVRISEAGTSVEGRPIHLVRVGHPQPPSDAQIAAGGAVLVVGSQHGDEPAAREAALQWLRDLAFTDEPRLLEALDATTVLVVPSANPDGLVASARWNADLLDVNRDHLALASPEARAIAGVLRDFRPDLVLDAHERPDSIAPDVQLLWPRNLNVHLPIRDLSRALVEERLFGDLAAAGYSVELYGPDPGPPGDENEHILRNLVGLRHGLGLLVESAGGQPAVERVAVHEAVMRSTLDFLGERSSEIAAAVSAAPGAKAAVGRERSEPFYLFGADNAPPTPDQILDPPPCAYVLSAAQAEMLEPQIALLPLRVEPAGVDVLLPMDQPLMTVIPLLVDSRARGPSVEALPRVSEMECAVVGA